MGELRFLYTGNVIDPLEVIYGCQLDDLLQKIDEGNLPPKEVCMYVCMYVQYMNKTFDYMYVWFYTIGTYTFIKSLKMIFIPYIHT
jgi:hypothetical protein